MGPCDNRSVDVRVDEGVREARRGDAGETRKELEEQRVAREVVGDTERHVAAALREVQVEPRVSLGVELHVEDEETVARGELARLRVARSPRRYDQPAAVHRVCLEFAEHPRDLVAEGGAAGRRVGPRETGKWRQKLP